MEEEKVKAFVDALEVPKRAIGYQYANGDFIGALELKKAPAGAKLVYRPGLPDEKTELASEIVNEVFDTVIENVANILARKLSRIMRGLPVDPFNVDEVDEEEARADLVGGMAIALRRVFPPSTGYDWYRDIRMEIARRIFSDVDVVGWYRYIAGTVSLWIAYRVQDRESEYSSEKYSWSSLKDDLIGEMFTQLRGNETFLAAVAYEKKEE